MACESRQSHRTVHSKKSSQMFFMSNHRCINSLKIIWELFSIALNLWPLIVAFIYLMITIPAVNSQEIDVNEVRNFAFRFGKDIFEGSSESTCLRKIASNFEKYNATLQWVDGQKMMEDMRNDVTSMLNWKKMSVERIANESERLAANHTYDKHLKFDYYNMKKIENSLDDNEQDSSDSDAHRMILMPHPNFEDRSQLVNMEYSAIHVPINVYDKSPDIVNDIKWSEHLTQFFKNNRAFDPGLTWQFFGSSTGFLRLYPATQFKRPSDGIVDLPDLYDCRMRPWYIHAAASPKDVVILLDHSGSMTGQRRDIAKNVVFNILDTLTDDDYVAAVKFSTNTSPIVNCFEDQLVQASKRNVKEIKNEVEMITTAEIANFTQALVYAFELLQKYHHNKSGSQCNQAIMLVTDGAPSNFEEIFQRYNWPNIPVRVFTYLIGREVSDSKDVHWMACHNRGYYTHVANLAEVREQVQQYLPVMSRPIVLSGDRPFVWTPVYADVSDIQLTEWVWEAREKARQRKLRREREGGSSESSPPQRIIAGVQEEDKTEIIEDKEDKEDKENKEDNQTEGYEESTSQTDDYDEKPEELQNTEPESQKKIKPKKGIHLMITLAAPVFDTRNYTNITYRILVKNVWQDSEPVQVRIANLLGVAGVDVPIRDIVKLTPAYKLGANGYSFVTTNNGFLLYHPDLRPIIQDLLKPLYNSVDMSEVEITDNDFGPRDFDSNITEIRNNMITRKQGWKTVKMKIHLDSMRRVITRSHTYHYGPIDHTPFSLAIVLPEGYGSYRVVGQVEVKRKGENFTHYFRGNNWRVHPDWVYCDNPSKLIQIPEESIKDFLYAIDNNSPIRWKTSSTRPQILTGIACDKELIQSLVFDARATDVDAEKCGTNFAPGNIEKTIFKMYGVVTTFVATRSGLTRFEDHKTEEEKMQENVASFIDIHTKATEEIYYQRAVDFHRFNGSAFVFSVPFDIGMKRYEKTNKNEKTKSNENQVKPNETSEILVTGSYAIFIGKEKESAPAAVVGLQFKHSIFRERFFNQTTKLNCLSDEPNDPNECYLLDNNAFVIVSENDNHTGKFFGEINDLLLQAMVDLNVYRKVHMYDYQAICFDIITPSGPGITLSTPFNHIRNIITWFWTKILMIHTHLWLRNSWNVFASEYNYESDYSYMEEEDIVPNKTRPRSCDKEFDLYEMQSLRAEQPIKGKYLCDACENTFIAEPIPYTNLLFLILNKQCACESSMKLMAKEIIHEDSCKVHAEMFRMRPKTCYNYHSQEKDIKQCGKGLSLIPSLFIILLTNLLALIVYY